MSRRLTQRGQERKTQLMAFAAQRFAEQGYHPTSVGEIVDGLGVGKGVFYWYFESKEQLFLELLRDSQQQLRRAQREAITDVDDPVERIALGIRAAVHWSAAHPEIQALLQTAATEERFAPAVRRGQEIAAEDARRHVAEGIERGQIRDVDPSMIGFAILGLTSQLVRTFIHDQGRDPDEVADACVALVLDGILARPTA